jgi:phenylalanyl-tRNA synthetase beta chain
MKLSAQWLRDFVDLKVDDRRLAENLTSIGMAVEGISGAGPSTVFEMEIGTNRPDAMNHYGVAREASAFYDLPLRAIEPKLPKAAASVPFPIAIAEPQLCPRFTGRVLRNVTVKPSPAQVVERLALLDQRPINNAVDATNYVLWEIGKPTHVFDLDLLEGGRIVVRRARDGETLKTLDGVERKLTSEDLVVADARKPVGLAGVMGGYDTMITEKTRNILIESAWWDPVTIRKASKRHVLHTDASHRFERGADYESTILSCNRVAELTLQSGGGELAGDVVDVIARRIDQAPIALRLSEVHRILGSNVDADEVVSILCKLGFDVTPEMRDASEFRVLVPSWRLDVEREIDLIEEVARLHGYDKFPNTLPAFVGAVVERPEANKDARLRTSALALGYNEAISLSFISREDAQKFSSAAPVDLANPLSEEASVMRTSIVPGMLDMLAYNLNRGSNDVRLFEAGNVYEFVPANSPASSRPDQPRETKRLCLGVTGSSVEPSFLLTARPKSSSPTTPELESFLYLKGDIEKLLVPFQHDSLHFDAKTASYYHPGRSARAVMDGSVVAQFGQIHREVATARKLRQDVFIGEIYLDQLYEHDLREPQYVPLPRYPAVERDFSFVFADSVIYEQIQETVSKLGIHELRSFMPVEIFRGGTVAAGKYSLLLRATFQSNDRTLREDEVAQWSEKIIRALEALGGLLRAQ